MIIDGKYVSPECKNVDVWWKPSDMIVWFEGYNGDGVKIFATKVEIESEKSVRAFVDFLDKMGLLDSFWVD